MTGFRLIFPIILLAWSARSSGPVDNLSHRRTSRQTEITCVVVVQNDGSAATCQGSTLIDLQPESLQEDPASLRALSVLQGNLPALPPGTLAHMPNLQNLTIFSSSLAELESASFQGIGNLLRLNISHNELENLDRPYFSLLKKLDSLTLAGNRLTSVKEDSFSGVPLLQFLDLSENILETLPAGVFRPIRGLETINLFGNQLTRLPAELFAGLQNLTSVDLSNNKLKHLPPKTFDNVPKLQKLLLSNNSLRALNSDVFNQPQRKLSLFNVDSNELVLLDVKALQTKLPALAKVALAPNPWSCSCLQVILEWMNWRKIQYLPKQFFDGKKPVCAVLKVDNVFDPVTSRITNQTGVVGCDTLTEQQVASLRTTYRGTASQTRLQDDTSG